MRRRNHIAYDLIFIVVSVAGAVWLVKAGLLETLLSFTHGLLFFDSFVAGLFFTSAFTTAPAIAVLGTIAQSAESLWIIAFFGALGAVCGDLVIYLFMRDRFEEDIEYILRQTHNGWLRSLLHIKLFRWLTFFLGGLVIASPLPDEIGLAMMGLSKTKISLFIPTSFIFNFIGILFIVLVARSI